MDIINVSTAILIKQTYLDKENACLKTLTHDLDRRLACEEARIVLERHRAKRAWELQTHTARATATYEMQEQARRQQSARFQKWQEQEQERNRKRKQESAGSDGGGEKQQDTDQESERKTRARPRFPQAAAFAGFYQCRRKGWWAKVETQRVCGYCLKEFTRFVLKCPGCQVVACDACRRVLVTGKTPDFGEGGGHVG